MTVFPARWPLECFITREKLIVAALEKMCNNVAKTLPVHHAVLARKIKEKAAVDEVGSKEEDRCWVLLRLPIA